MDRHHHCHHCSLVAAAMGSHLQKKDHWIQYSWKLWPLCWGQIRQNVINTKRSGTGTCWIRIAASWLKAAGLWIATSGLWWIAPRLGRITTAIHSWLWWISALWRISGLWRISALWWIATWIIFIWVCKTRKIQNAHKLINVWHNLAGEKCVWQLRGLLRSTFALLATKSCHGSQIKWVFSDNTSDTQRFRSRFACITYNCEIHTIALEHSLSRQIHTRTHTNDANSIKSKWLGEEKLLRWLFSVKLMAGWVIVTNWQRDSFVNLAGHFAPKQLLKRNNVICLSPFRTKWLNSMHTAYTHRLICTWLFLVGPRIKSRKHKYIRSTRSMAMRLICIVAKSLSHTVEQQDACEHEVSCFVIVIVLVVAASSDVAESTSMCCPCSYDYYVCVWVLVSECVSEHHSFT